MCGRYALGISIENLPETFNSTVLNSDTNHTIELRDQQSSDSSEKSYETTASIDGSDQTIHLTLSSGFNASYNIPPTGTGVIIYMEKPQNTKDPQAYHIEASKFGLLPNWIKPQDSSPVKKGAKNGPQYSREIQQHQAKLFNCRRETLTQPRTIWATPRKHTRCVVPISGYFEWLTSKQGKIPYYIHSPDSPLLFLAGLYSHNYNYNDTEMVKNGQKYFSSFSIVTGPGGGKGKNDMRWLHSRKPIFLEPNSRAWYDWLRPDDHWDEKLETCLDTETNPVYESLEWYTVAKSVGNPVHKGPDVIKEEKAKQQSISSFFSPRAVKKEEKPQGKEQEGSEEEKVKREDLEESSAEEIKSDSKRRANFGEKGDSKRVKTEDT